MKIPTSEKKAQAQAVSKIIGEKLLKNKEGEDEKVDLVKLTTKMAKRKLAEEKEDIESENENE